jgi:hypothetical protein
MGDRSVRAARLVFGVLLLTVADAGAGPAEDASLSGYAAAVLERELKLRGSSVTARDGALRVVAPGMTDADRVRAVGALSTLPGVSGVEVVVAAAPSAARGDPGERRRPVGFLPGEALFDPLLADPRWPHFAASYRHYLDDPDVSHVAAVSFGESFAVYRGNAGERIQWELGLQAGVFSVFDLAAESFDLLNTDYFVAGYGSYRWRGLSGITRLFHQSSHVGDEFLLRTRAQRINLSYEGIDTKLSWELPYGLRAYGGGGYLVQRDPPSIDPWSAQGGLEFTSPWTLARDRLRPVAGLDLQFREENDWSADLSLRAGLQLDRLPALGRNLQLLLEYYSGHSPDGQFFRREIEYLGLGLHFHF